MFLNDLSTRSQGEKHLVNDQFAGIYHDHIHLSDINDCQLEPLFYDNSDVVTDISDLPAKVTIRISKYLEFVCFFPCEATALDCIEAKRPIIPAKIPATLKMDY